MTTTTRKLTASRLRHALAALALAGVIGGIAAGPALADDWHHERIERQVHRDRFYHHEPRHRVYVAPRYEYAPPAPVYGYGYGYGAPSLNFTIPLR